MVTGGFCSEPGEIIHRGVVRGVGGAFQGGMRLVFRVDSSFQAVHFVVSVGHSADWQGLAQGAERVGRGEVHRPCSEFDVHGNCVSFQIEFNVGRMCGAGFGCAVVVSETGPPVATQKNISRRE